MRHYKCIVVYCIALLSITQVYGQSNANTYLKAVYGNLQKVKDYAVQANIKVDMPFIRMLPIHVKIFFKQKDKFKVESKGIAIVPRQGFDQLSKILANNNSFTAIIQGEEKITAIQAIIVNMIPLSDTSDIILAKFWIDPIQSVILKSQLTTKSNGTIGTEYTYGSQVEYGLPDKMVFSVDVKKFKMPISVTANMNRSGANKKEDNGKGNKKGKIYIVLTNYQINKGISDNVFKK